LRSRNDFSQVTAVFADEVKVYFARRQLVERLGEAREGRPSEFKPHMGPIMTGLDEIFMWTVRYTAPDAWKASCLGEPGWQSDDRYLTPEGLGLRTELEKAAYLRTFQEWIVRPQIKTVPGVARVEGKMFEPMAPTVIIALVAAFVLSLTFVPALIAILKDAMTALVALARVRPGDAGGGDRHGGPEAARDRVHPRLDQRHHADPGRTSGPLCALRRRPRHGAGQP
jgi:Cu/Ag efflux pump CusA